MQKLQTDNGLHNREKTKTAGSQTPSQMLASLSKFYPHSVASNELHLLPPMYFSLYKQSINRKMQKLQTDMVYIKGKEIVKIPFVIKSRLPTSSIELPEKTFLLACHKYTNRKMQKLQTDNGLHKRGKKKEKR